jgi:DNA-3-methyladenine glycosylase II
VRIVLEQQVSLASARAAFERLAAALGGRVEPGPFLDLDDERLRAAGFSRQKAGYCRGVAAAIVAGELDLDGLAGLPGDEARRRLLALRGVGGWTADIYLLMALGRPDVWPVGDLALAVAAHQVKRLAARPTPAELEALAEAWRPWRAVAARMLWQDYLSRREPAESDQGEPAESDQAEPAGADPAA